MPIPGPHRIVCRNGDKSFLYRHRLGKFTPCCLLIAKVIEHYLDEA